MITSFRKLNKRSHGLRHTFLAGIISQVTCKKHKKSWMEGDDFERLGGRACEECVLEESKIQK